jgi:hypothetical protein
MKYLVHKKIKFDVMQLLQKSRVFCYECDFRKKIQSEGLKAYVLFANFTESAGCHEAYIRLFPHPKCGSHILNSCGG